jgi:hypothetical protein
MFEIAGTDGVVKIWRWFYEMRKNQRILRLAGRLFAMRKYSAAPSLIVSCFKVVQRNF